MTLSTTLFKGIRCLTNEQFSELLNNGSIVVNGETITYDKDFLYMTPEDYTTLVRQHTEQIAQNTENIASNKALIDINTDDIAAIKASQGGSGVDLTDIRNTITEIILRDTNQDNEINNIKENYAQKSDVVTLTDQQKITGIKTFAEHIYLANADGTVDRISHLNNNFIIHSGATNSSVLNIDEGLEKIYAFNNELAFKSDIAEASGTTVYVDGTGVVSLSFNADPQTQINLLAESIDDNKSELTTSINTKVSKSGDTMTGELIASGGIKFGNNKVNSENSGNTLRTYHIENNEEYDILNYTHGGMLTVNNAETPLILQGYDDRPTYVSGSGIMSDLALESDIPVKVSQLTNDANYATVDNVDAKIAALVDSAPETLDTLAEVAQAIKDNETVVTALNSAIGSKADKSAVPTSLSQLTTDSTHRLVTDAEKSTWNSKLSSESDPTVPDWAKQATKPEYDYSEIKNAPEGTALYSTIGQNTDGAMTQKATTDALDLKANTADIDFDAIEFSEIEKQKVDNNLFDFVYNGTATPNVTIKVSDRITMNTSCNDANGGLVITTKLTEDGYVYTFHDVDASDYYAETKLTFSNLKPSTKYRLGFYQTQTGGDGYGGFLGSRTFNKDDYISFTTDSNGSYTTYRGIEPRGDSTGILTVSRVQLMEFDEYVEYQKYYGELLHNGTNNTVIEHWISSDGSTWYKKWADGWKECGVKSVTTVSSEETIVLPITFTTNKFFALGQIISTHAYASFRTGDRTTNTINIAVRYEGGVYSGESYDLYCCGY